MTTIRIGIGGWDYAPWRGLFYPDGLRKKDELGYAATRLTSIEVNATFYRTQTPATFRAWHDATPEGFVFSVKAARAAAIRKEAEEAKPAIAQFLNSGLTELGPKLGAILWQLPGGRRFDPDGFARFLDLLPPFHDGVPLRHAVEAEHGSFNEGAAGRLLGERGIARVILEKEGVTPHDEVTADHVYLRLQGTVHEEETGYSAAALDERAARLKALVEPRGRHLFCYVIAGAKHRAPAAAMALIDRVA